MKELMRSIAAGAILYEYFEESNAFLTAEIFERCIDLYKDLCAKDENAIKKCIEYIQKEMRWKSEHITTEVHSITHKGRE